MSKRAAEPLDGDGVPLKAGERPVQSVNSNEEEEFEDEFEDEFDSEDEIIEAGVDGRPDQEREAEEKRGMWLTLEALCDCLSMRIEYTLLTGGRCDGRRPADIHTWPRQTCRWRVPIA